MGIQPWGTPRGPSCSLGGAQPLGGTGCHWVPATVALGPSLCPQGTQSHCTDVPLAAGCPCPWHRALWGAWHPVT